MGRELETGCCVVHDKAVRMLSYHTLRATGTPQQSFFASPALALPKQQDSNQVLPALHAPTWCRALHANVYQHLDSYDTENLSDS